MNFLKRTKFLAAVAAFLPSAATAAITVNINQTGSNVVATASGSLDLTGLTILASNFGLAGGGESIAGSFAYIGLGSDAGFLTGFTGLTGPTQFGSGGLVNSSTFAGTSFAINGSGFGDTVVFLPIGYTSGSGISSTATWLGQSFASLGITAGQYVYASQNDTVTINIGPVNGAVPEPSTWAMMLLGFGAVGMAVRRGRKRTLLLA